MNFKAEVVDKYLREADSIEPGWISMDDEHDTMFIRLFDENGILLMFQLNDSPFMRVKVLVADRVDVNTEGLLAMLNKFTAEHSTYSYSVTEDNELCGTFNFVIEDNDFTIPFFFGYIVFNVHQMIPEMIEILNFLDRQIPEGLLKANDKLHNGSNAAGSAAAAPVSEAVTN